MTAPRPYHVTVSPGEDDPALDEAFADSVIGDQRCDVIVIVAGPRYLEAHVEGIRSRERLALALAVASGLLVSHDQLFAPGVVIHACWDDENEAERRSA